MPQIQTFETGNARGKLADMLGMSLGQGIGNGLNTFFANRSLNSVLQDKALEGAPQSKKLEAIRSALSPYGEKGQEVFKQRMEIENLEHQEKEKTKQEAKERAKGKALGKYLKGSDLSEEEESLFTPQEFVAMYKARNPKAPAVPVSERPVTDQQRNAIKEAHAVPGYDKMPETEKYQTLLDHNVSPTLAEKEAKLAVEQGKREHEHYTDDRDYNSKISRPIMEAAQQRLKNSAIEKGISQQLRRDIASGDVSGIYPFMVDKLGLESFRNPASARFSSAVKNLFVGSLKEIPGARPNQFIERFLSTAQPMIGRDPEANESVMDLHDFIQDVGDEHAKLELKLGKEDRAKLGYAKDDISERAWDEMGDFVNRRQEEMARTIRERHEEGKETQDLLLEVLRGEVPPNTPLTPKMAMIFYIKNNKDEAKAIAEAQKAGFVLPEYLE